MNDKIRNLRFFAKTFFKHFARDVHFFFHENVSACERRTEVCALDLMNTVSSTRRGGKVCEPAVELWLVEPGPSTNNKKKKQSTAALGNVPQPGLTPRALLAASPKTRKNKKQVP